MLVEGDNETVVTEAFMNKSVVTIADASGFNITGFFTTISPLKTRWKRRTRFVEFRITTELVRVREHLANSTP